MIKSLIFLLGIAIAPNYVIPGWKVIDLMWERPLHPQLVFIKARHFSGIQEDKIEGERFIISFGTGSHVKFINLDEKTVLPETESSLGIIFGSKTKDELLSGLKKLGVNVERVTLDRLGGSVCFVLGDPSAKRLWVDKDSLVPLLVESRKWSLYFQNYKDFSGLLFPVRIELKAQADAHTVIIEEVNSSQ